MIKKIPVIFVLLPMNLSKTKIRYIKSLQIRKYRTKEQKFLVEGAKSLHELIQSDYTIDCVVCTDDFTSDNGSMLQLLLQKQIPLLRCTPAQLSEMGTLENNRDAIAIAQMKRQSLTPREIASDEVILALDTIQDPGNLGAIIRVADWYGIQKIIASEHTVDFYNSKVISASMGSFLRVSMAYVSLPVFLGNLSIPVYGAFLHGKNVHETQFPQTGFCLLIGNESNGISAAVEAKTSEKITIPKYGKAESLNAAMATAIILDNIKKQRNA